MRSYYATKKHIISVGKLVIYLVLLREQLPWEFTIFGESIRHKIQTVRYTPICVQKTLNGCWVTARPYDTPPHSFCCVSSSPLAFLDRKSYHRRGLTCQACSCLETDMSRPGYAYKPGTFQPHIATSLRFSQRLTTGHLCGLDICAIRVSKRAAKSCPWLV